MGEDLTETAHRRRLWVRAYNGVAGLFPVKTASVEEMLRLAERRAQFADWGPTSFREGLELLVKETNEDALLHPLGRKLVHDSLLDRLVQRLQVVKTLSEQPRITELPVTSPILIAGFARTGTTLLHRVLARDPRLRAPLCWEADEPAPPPHPDSADTDPRVKRSDRTWKLLYHLAPRAAVIHTKSARLAEECYPLLERSFTCLNLAVFVARPEYEQWLLAAPPAIVDAAYEFYRRQLQLLQLHYPPRRWVLKAPAHAPFVDGFVRAFPDAKIIYTHRDPVSIVGSIASLLTAARSVPYRTVDPRKIGEETLDMVDQVTRRFMRARASLPAGTFCDVHYDRLTREPMAVLQDVYAHLGLAFDDDMQAQAQQWLAAEATKKTGEHRYALGDFGLDEQTVRRRLQEYIDVSRAWT
jgi:Sulfotransferase family